MILCSGHPKVHFGTIVEGSWACVCVGGGGRCTGGGGGGPPGSFTVVFELLTVPCLEWRST